METRPISGVPQVAVTPVRLDQAPVRDAVRTDLAPPVAVAAQAGAEQTRLGRDKRREPGEPQQKSTETSFTTDRETGDLVYRVLDSQTRSVVTQYPYDSLLRLRAYIRAHDDQQHRGE